jgi:hypothetical protein
VEFVDALELYATIIDATPAQAADWILSFGSGTTPQQLASLVRDAIRLTP